MLLTRQLVILSAVPCMARIGSTSSASLRCTSLKPFRNSFAVLARTLPTKQRGSATNSRTCAIMGHKRRFGAWHSEFRSGETGMHIPVDECPAEASKYKGRACRFVQHVSAILSACHAF